MIFYTPQNSEGRTILCTTQADSDAIQKNAPKVDIPVDKNGLKSYIQDALDLIHSLQATQPTLDAPAEPVEALEPDKIKDADGWKKQADDYQRPANLDQAKSVLAVNLSYEAMQIEDFILNHASVAQVENLFSCLGNRFAELRPKE